MILSYDMILENFVRKENKQTDRQRIQNLRPLLSPWIVGVSGPILEKEDLGKKLDEERAVKETVEMNWKKLRR